MLAAEGYQIPRYVTTLVVDRGPIVHSNHRIMYRFVVRFIMQDNDPIGFPLRRPQSGCCGSRDELTSPGSQVSEESRQSDKTDATSAAQDIESGNHLQLNTDVDVDSVYMLEGDVISIY